MDNMDYYWCVAVCRLFFFVYCLPIFSEVMLVSGRVHFNLFFFVVPPSTCRAPQKNTEVLKTFWPKRPWRWGLTHWPDVVVVVMKLHQSGLVGSSDMFFSSCWTLTNWETLNYIDPMMRMFFFIIFQFSWIHQSCMNLFKLNWPDFTKVHKSFKVYFFQK